MSEVRRTQEQRRTEAEEALIEAAAEVIAEAGPAALTLARVGERSGYSRGLATHHFGSKGALLQRVADTVTSQFRLAMLATVDSDATALDQLLALTDVYLEVVINPRPENQARLMLIADAVARPDTEVGEVVVAASLEFRAAVADALARSAELRELPSDFDAGAFATTVVGLLRGVSFESMLDPTVDLRAVKREIAMLFRARLGAQVQEPAGR